MRHPGKCQYCGKDCPKDVDAHERFCKTKSLSSSAFTSESHTDTSSSAIQDAGTPDTHQEGRLRKVFNSIFHKPKKEITEVDKPQDLIEGLPSYQIPETNPKKGIGKLTNRKKDFIQVVLVSPILEPKFFWAEKTGINRIQYKDRMYRLPRDIRGNVFFWHVDKNEPLVDTANASEEDAESSFHELQLFNMAYSVGRAAGANDLLNNLKLILLAVVFIVVLAAAILIYINRLEKEMIADDTTIITTLNYINQTMPR